MRLAHYALAALAVRLGVTGVSVAVPLLALARTDSVAVGGLLVASMLVPHVVAAPVAGRLIDRAARPELLVAGAAMAQAAALVLVSVALGAVPVAVLVPVLLAVGCVGPLLTGGLSSRLGGLVAADRLPRAFGVDAMTYGVAGMTGPAIAAAVTAASSAAAAMVVLAGITALGALAVAGLAMGSGAAPESSRLCDSVVAIVGSRPLGVVTATSTAAEVPTGMLPIAAVLIAGAAGRTDAAGWLVAAVAAGGLVGSLAWTVRPAPVDRAISVLLVALVAAAVPLAVVAAVPLPLPAVGALFAVAGLAQGPLVGAMFTARQAFAPAAVRGQVFTLGAGLRVTSAAGGAALAGVLAGLGPAIVLGVAAAVPFAAAVAGALAHPRGNSRGPVGAQR